jgi:gamma-glutamylcyclotransferase (GGCT)/AIG2-like uncharacterized protein YtfP
MVPEDSNELVAFNGTVMRGEPAHSNLRSAQFVEEVLTAPEYRLFSIRDEYPAMLWVGDGGSSIECELYSVPVAAWPAIEASEPPGLFRGSVTLEDGRTVDGMLGSPQLIDEHGIEISHFGGWKRYQQHLRGHVQT